MKATVTKHALYLQGALLTTNNQIIAIAAATIDVLLPILEGTLPSNIKLLSVGRFELDSPTSVKAVYDPLINIDVRLAPKVKPVASIYANNKVQHLFACQTNSVDAKKTYHVDKLYLIDESSDINSVTPAQALSILLSKQIVKSNALSQSKARDLVTWLENTKLYALPANSILAVMNSNKSQFDTFAVESETTDSFLSPSHIPQFKKFSKQGSQAINLHLLPNEAKRKENIQRFASISTNPSIELIEWARKRLESGDSKAQIYRDLLDTGYCMELAQKAMYGFKPQVKREQIEHASERKSLETTPSLYFAFANLAITEDQTCERIADTRAQIYIKEHAFSEEECQALLELIKGHFQPSTVVDQVGNSNDGYRTSSTAFLEQISAEKNQQVKSRIGQMMGIDDAYLESLQVQRYGTGQEYKVHCDFFHSSSPTFRACTDKVGQRTWTCVLYLNDDFEGGATRFNLLDKNVQPKRGMALCWNNLLPLGKPNEWTSHCGEPVKKGYKYIISAWFREKPYS
jgi:prolyl 4-hydroxylase